MLKAIKTLTRKFVHLNGNQGSHVRLSALAAAVPPGGAVENPPHRGFYPPRHLGMDRSRHKHLLCGRASTFPPPDRSSARGGHPHLNVNYDNERVAPAREVRLCMPGMPFHSRRKVQGQPLAGARVTCSFSSLCQKILPQSALKYLI